MRRHANRGLHPEGVCQHCGRLLVYVQEVGWLDPAPGGTYDMCAADLYANHRAR